MGYQLRKAELNDLEEITALFKNAVEKMITNHIFQWDEIYPTRQDFEEDIRLEQMYLMTDQGKILSVFVINQQCDEQYQTGKWAYDESGAVVIHRFCVNPYCQNKGIGKKTIVCAEEMLSKRGFTSIRLDAFPPNFIALRLYASLGYQKVGEVHFRKGLFYLYEKPLPGKTKEKN